MSPEQVALWDVEFDRLAAIEADACGICTDLRRHEARTNKVKTDTREETNAKAGERRSVQKELAAHLKEVLELNVASPGHEFVTLAGVMGSALPAVFDDDRHDEKEEPDESLTLQGVVEPRAKDCRKLVVGQVPIHLRINLTPIFVVV